MDIHRVLDVARNTIYRIQSELPLELELEIGATYRAENIQSGKRVNIEFKYNGDIYVSYHDNKDRFFEKKITKEASNHFRIIKKI